MAEVRKPFALYNDEPSMTKQSFVDEVDINQIVARARKGAAIAHVNSRVAMYGDFTNVPSYQAALDLVNRAHGMFMSLDAAVRERFANDPARMVVFLQDARNYDEAVKLGLVSPKVIVPGDEIPPVESNLAASGSVSRAQSGVSTEIPAPGKGKQGGSK